MDSNEAYGVSSHIEIGDHSKLAKSLVHIIKVTILYILSVDSNEAYEVQLQQKQEFEENTSNMYDYPTMDADHIETMVNAI